MEPSPPLGIKDREGLGSSRSSADPIFDDEYLFKMNGDPHFLFFYLEELLNINILLVFQKIVIYFSCRKTTFSAKFWPAKTRECDDFVRDRKLLLSKKMTCFCDTKF